MACTAAGLISVRAELPARPETAVMSGDSARVSILVAVWPPLAFEIFTEEIDR